VANRYWVGGTGTWDNSDTSHWSTSSGGSSGASVPGIDDDVIINGSSGGGTITHTATALNASLNCTGFTGTLALGSAALITTGSITLGSGMTVTASGGGFDVRGFGGTFTSNGVTGSWYLIGRSATLTLGDALTITGALETGNSGSLNTNGQAVSCGSLSIAVGTLTLGASTVTVTGTGTVISLAAGITVSAGTSTLKVTDASASSKTINLGGKTINNLWLTGAGSGAFLITESFTCADFKVDTPPHSIIVTAGKTITCTTSFTVNGTAGNLMTFESSLAGSSFSLSKSSGAVNQQYLSLKDSAAGGGATWNAAFSTNVSGNSGWTFNNPRSAEPRVARATYLRM